jgi:hypothetical protein
MTVFQQQKWLRSSFLKQLFGKYTLQDLDPDPDLAVKIPDPAKRSGSGSPSTSFIPSKFDG